MKFICDDCNFKGKESQFMAARHLEQRLTPGSVYTNLECPHCGALAFPAPDPDLTLVVTFATKHDRSAFMSYCRLARESNGTITGLYAGLMTSILKRVAIKD